MANRLGLRLCLRMGFLVSLEILRKLKPKLLRLDYRFLKRTLSICLQLLFKSI